MIKFLNVLLVNIFVFVMLSLNVFAVDTTMAHNIYSDPDLSSTSGAFDTFMIDFKGVETPIATYWALCNWGMDLKSFASLNGYYDVTGGGAYAGLQNTPSGKKAILSFWEVQYKKSPNSNTVEKLRASRIYPSGENFFGGEGEGTNNIVSYNWSTNKWYRMVIHVWNDRETGKTFVGQWFLDVATGKWDLISYFNTSLTNSYLIGSMSQFQENYLAEYSDSIRSFNFKNMYVRDREKSKWISLNTTVLSYDTKAFGFNTEGTHSFGATSEYFYGSAGGYVDNQDVYDRNSHNSLKLTINQPLTPTTGKIEIESVDVITENKRTTISWNVTEMSTPQLSYVIEIIDPESNEVIDIIERTRPHEKSFIYSNPTEKEYDYILKVNDIFNSTSSLKSLASDRNQEEVVEDEIIDETEDESTTDEYLVEVEAGEESRDKNNIYIYAFIVVSLVIIGVVGFIVYKKKKSNCKVKSEL